ncbi:hypothetical protein [Streptomyces sp. TRM64462]|uniref:hypothetical protein n=1 Tax=Streptomyces sp. TRM64462 TaxID=2741726 RepID=UPI001586E077|nr:hypothetical protein [Streptomyces sp. TRM64462]
MVPKELRRPRSPQRLILAAGAVFALLFAGFLAPASTATAATSAASAAAGGGDKHAKVLKVVLVHEYPVFGSFTETDPGDTVLLEDPAFMNGTLVGDSLTRIQFLEGGSFLLDCTVRLTDKGNLVFAGGEEASNLETATTFAVTGGTGTFSGTGGHVTITPTEHNGAEAALLTFHLKH